MPPPPLSEDPLPASDPVAADTAEMLLSEERATVDTVWVPQTRLRVQRRIVTESVTVEVQVRREELVLTYDDLPAGRTVPLPPGEAPETAEPMVFVLHREEAAPAVTVRPYERVTLEVSHVQGAHNVGYTLAAERLVPPTVTGTPTTDPLGRTR